MVFIQLFLLCISVVAYAANEPKNPLSGTTFKIKFYNNEESEYPLEIVNNFTTIKNMIEDIGLASDPLPLLNIKKSTFDCLQHLMIEKEYPLEFTKFTLFDEINKKSITLDDIRKKIIKKLENKKYKNVNKKDLLVAANFLSADNNCINVIASFYADSLKNKIPIIQQNLSCDDLPIDLEPLVAGWLLRDLFKNQKPQIKQKPYQFGVILKGPFISNSESNNNFVCVWQGLGGEGLFESDALSNKILFFDSLKENLLTKSFILDPKIEMNDNQTQCVISNDGTYMAVLVHKQFHGFFNWIPTILIYNLRESKKNTPNHIQLIDTIDLKGINMDVFRIKFYDDNNLKITEYDRPITIKNRLKENFQKKSFLYNINEKKINDIGNEKAESFSFPNNNGLDNELIYYEYNIQESFIPDFIPSLKTKLNPKLKNRIYYQKTKFDPQHLHINFTEKKKAKDTHHVGTYYPCDPNLIKAINFLNKEVVNKSNKRVLAATCLLYHMYTNPTGWITSWKESTKDISDNELYGGSNPLIPAEIEKIYNLQEKINQQKILIENQTKQQEIRSLSLWESWQKGKLKQRIALLFSDYKKPLQYGLGTLGVATIGAAWWWSKKGTLGSQMPIKLQNPKFSTSVSNPILNVNRP